MPEQRDLDEPNNPVSPFWGGRPVIDWSPTPWDPEADRVLTKAARITAIIVVGQRRIPTASEVHRILTLGDEGSEGGTTDRALMEAVVSAEFWDPPATDPGWGFDPPRAKVIKLGRVRVTGIQPAVVLSHPRLGWRFGSWSSRPHTAGNWPWDQLDMHGCGVVKARGLKPWRHEVRGFLYLGPYRQAITRRILPEHVRSAESVIRVDAFSKNEQVRRALQI